MRLCPMRLPAVLEEQLFEALEERPIADGQAVGSGKAYQPSSMISNDDLTCTERCPGSSLAYHSLDSS